MKYRLERQLRRKPRKRNQQPWKYDHRNPDMVVHTGWLEGRFGMLQIVRGDLTAEEAQALARESIENSPNPTWDKDKTYY